MSKIPAWSRSFHSTWLNVLSSCADCVSPEALKSGTAMRIFSTPSPVPVLIQSWAAEGKEATSRTNRAMENAGRFIIFRYLPKSFNAEYTENVAINGDSRTKTLPRLYFLNTAAARDQTYRCAEVREPQIDRATALRWIAPRGYSSAVRFD